jgi:ribosomal protein S18 acetylase RimI-like enzyme
MSYTIVFSMNQSSMDDLASHLVRVDATFEPALSSRVEIRAYAQKLHNQAVRFEAWLGEELIGLVACYCNQPVGGKAFATSVSVWSEYQGQGIATRLMRQCIEHLRGLGFCHIELEVNQRSLSAVALYQKIGFNILRSSGSTLTLGMILGR